MRHDMNDIKEALELFYKKNISARKASLLTCIPKSTVSDYIKRIGRLGLSPDEILLLPLDELRNKLYPEKDLTPKRILPDPAYIAKEMKKPGVTYSLLWDEYIENNPQGYSLTQFKHYMKGYKDKLDPSFRNFYKGGELMFVDFSGLTMVYREDGISKIAQIFVSSLAASSCLFAKATPSQEMEHFNLAHKSAFSYYGGVPQAVTPDNLKPAVIKNSKKELNLNRSYKDLARHYEFVIAPARPRKPKDKPGGENGVKIVQRWIIAALRKHIFFSIDEINAAIIPLLDKYNNKKMRYVDKSRFERLSEIELPNMKSLPNYEYFFRTYEKRIVPKDYHIIIDKSFYSVPFNLIGQTVSVWHSETSVEIYHNGEIKAVHPRVKGVSTLKEHMPINHLKMTERYNHKPFLLWGLSIGFNTAKFVKKIMEKKLHITIIHRHLLQLKEITKGFDNNKIEEAAKKAFSANASEVRHFRAILESKDKSSIALETHENIRGEDYYREESLF